MQINFSRYLSVKGEKLLTGNQAGLQQPTVTEANQLVLTAQTDRTTAWVAGAPRVIKHGKEHQIYPGSTEQPPVNGDMRRSGTCQTLPLQHTRQGFVLGSGLAKQCFGLNQSVSKIQCIEQRHFIVLFPNIFFF